MQRPFADRFHGIPPAFLLGVVSVFGCQDSATTAPTVTTAAASAPTSPATNASLAAQGQWSSVFSWPIVAVHLNLLPSGQVLSFGKLNGGIPQLWDPLTGLFTAASAPSRLFCAGQTLLPDGRLLTVGGDIATNLGLPNTNTFDFRTGLWTAGPMMARGRWYPTATELSNGAVVILAGTDQNGATVTTPEVWTTTGTLRQLTTANKSLPDYPRTFLAPNGKVFYAGELQQTSYLNTAGTGGWSSVSLRQFGKRDYGSAVMYQQGKILYVGGGDPPTNSAEIINLNQTKPQWQSTGSMTYARRQLNATLLPTGEVLVLGGTSAPGFSDETGGVLPGEIWSPTTGQWTVVASASVVRVYHGTALLLPDGRILHTGSGDATAATNEFNAQLYSPPYLFQGPRPTISSLPPVIHYNQGFQLLTPDAAIVSRVTLIHLSSVTHAFDMGQRFGALGFTRQANGLAVNPVTSKNNFPPGYYMVFILNGANVPSAGMVVQLN